MKIQNIQSYNNTNNKTRNNIQKGYKQNYSAQPSFQHRVIYGNWEPHILEKIKNNTELQKLEQFLEKKLSVLELTIKHHGWSKNGKSEQISIDCIYDRRTKISGRNAEIVPPTPTENILKEIDKIQYKDILKKMGYKPPIEEEPQEVKKKSFWSRIFSK